MTTCEWCGHEHSQVAICSSRPKWSRRGFLALLGAGLAGLAVPTMPVETWPMVVIPSVETWWRNQPLTFKGIPIVYDKDCPPGRVYITNEQMYAANYATIAADKRLLDDVITTMRRLG